MGLLGCCLGGGSALKRGRNALLAIGKFLPNGLKTEKNNGFGLIDSKDGLFKLLLFFDEEGICWGRCVCYGVLMINFLLGCWAGWPIGEAFEMVFSDSKDCAIRNVLVVLLLF